MVRTTQQGKQEQDQRLDRDIKDLKVELENIGYECRDGGRFSEDVFCSYPDEEKGISLNKQFG